MKIGIVPINVGGPATAQSMIDTVQHAEAAGIESLWTFEHVAWLAHKNGVRLRMPPMHPFNPLPLLRLASLFDSPIDLVQRLFRFVWVEGKLPTDAQAWSALLEELEVDPAELDAPEVKQAARTGPPPPPARVRPPSGWPTGSPPRSRPR